MTKPFSDQSNVRTTGEAPVETKPTAGFKRLARFLFVFAFIPYFVVLILLTVFQRSLLYPATRVDSLPVSSVTQFPQEQLRDVEITTDDGVTIRGWLFLASPIEEGDADALGDRWLVIHFHGNAGHRGTRIPDALEFVQEGCDVLLIDYRGYGDSDGYPSRKGLVTDAVATWDYAVGELKRSPERIILFGESLGGAVAVELGSHCCGNHEQPAGMLLVSTFASLPETAARLYPMFPVWWVVRDRFSSRDIIGSVTCPIIQVHGRLDELVTIEEGQQLFAATPDASSNGVPKHFVQLEVADHDNVPVHELGRALRELMRDW